MKLIDRLKPEFREKLEEANIYYPNTVNCICDELESKKFVLNLSYECVLNMNMIFRCDNPFFYFNEIK